MNSHDLAARIHQFERGPGRRLFKIYTAKIPDLPVADAIVRGVISEAEVGPDLMELLRGGIEFARMYGEESEGGEEEEPR